MKKWWIMAIAIMLVGAIAVPIAWAQNENTQTPSNAAGTQLTESQKKELAQLYSKITELKKQIVDKYLEFGVIDQERAEFMKQRIDQMEKFRAEQGYLPGFGRGKFNGGFGRRRGMGFGGQCPFIQQNPSQPTQTSQ